MNKGSKSDSHLRDVSLKIQTVLAEEGFLLSSQNPFFNWARGEEAKICRPEDLGLDFYIIDPPIPKIAPFDVASVFVSIDRVQKDSIYFDLTLYFSKLLEPLEEAEEIHALYEKHDNDWFVKIDDYLDELQRRFSLFWESEYDVAIEDSLHGEVPLEIFYAIPLIMQRLRQMYDRWHKHEENLGKRG